MPNHITNHVFIPRPSEMDWDNYDREIKVIQDFIKSDQSEFDFEKLLPYPEKFAEMDRIAREAERQGIPWDKRPKDGFNSGGYDWCVQNWGTKWNAYHIQTNDYGWQFDTAWSSPQPVIEALSSKFPSLGFKVAWADEGGGCGYYAYLAGGLIDQQYPNEYGFISLDADLFEKIVKGF